MKKHLRWAIQILIAGAGIAYILFFALNWTTRIVLPDGSHIAVEAVDRDWVTPAESLDQAFDLETKDGRIRRSDLSTPDKSKPQFEPAFTLVVAESRWPLLLAGLGVILPVYLLQALRWRVLMRARGIDVGYGVVFRLTMAGQFFSLCMPGTTGGDLMKAYYVTRGTDQRADAVVSIAVDRVCGTVALLLVVGIIGLFSLDDPLIRRITMAMWLGLVLLVIAASLYASKTIRARVRLGSLVGKVPGVGALRKLDALVAAYRNHLGALGAAISLGLPGHLLLASSMAVAGFALGVDQPYLYLLGAVPIVLMLWSMPVSGPLGLGPLDYVAVQIIIGSSETTVQQAMIMFIAYRLYVVVVGLAGSLATFGAGKPSAKVAREQAQA